MKLVMMLPINPDLSEIADLKEKNQTQMSSLMEAVANYRSRLEKELRLVKTELDQRTIEVLSAGVS